MDPFVVLMAAVVALLVVRSCVRFYREREVFERYDARLRLAEAHATDDTSADAGDAVPSGSSAD